MKTQGQNRLIPAFLIIGVACLWPLVSFADTYREDIDNNGSEETITIIGSVENDMVFGWDYDDATTTLKVTGSVNWEKTFDGTWNAGVYGGQYIFVYCE